VDVTTVDVASPEEAVSGLTPPQSGGRGGGSGPLARLLGQAGAAKLSVALTVDETSATIQAYRTVPPDVSALLRAVVAVDHQRRVMAEAGVAPATIAQAQRPLPVTTSTIQPPKSNSAGQNVAALAAGILLYASVGIGGAAVASGVAQEKTTRTAEVLLAAVRPSQLMSGKVLGIGLVGLGQLAVAVSAALVTNVLVKSSNVPAEVDQLLPAILLWFVLGYTLYGFGYAAAGAMVARQEEVQSVSMPFTAFLVGGFLLLYATIGAPDSGWVRVLSFLPPLAPILMPARLALGHLEAWEMPVAIVITLVATYGMARLAGRIYSAGIVRGGARLAWSAALRESARPR
jgi:ABC-2 type transport system permease protein